LTARTNPELFYEIIAARIIGAAMKGERDPIRLRDIGLAALGYKKDAIELVENWLAEKHAEEAASQRRIQERNSQHRVEEAMRKLSVAFTARFRFSQALDPESFEQ
jgi:hypothetical protein